MNVYVHVPQDITLELREQIQHFSRPLQHVLRHVILANQS
jgi:hypothetical protein